MCMLTNEFSLASADTEQARKRNLMMFLKPNKDKEFYRFRLLNFRAPEKSDRTSPFITRWVHQHWGKTDKGINVVDDTVTCLTTEAPQVKYDGNRYTDCPICRKANENYGIMKASGFKDKVARDNHRKMKRAFQAIIPVYVVNDPNNDKNNGRLRCFMITEKAPKKRKNPITGQFEEVGDQIGLTYADFLKIVNAEFEAAKAFAGSANQYSIWNGGMGKDFFVRVDDVESVQNEGQPNEYRSKKRCITKMGFLKTTYEIPGINKDALDDFPFDETFYTSSTVAELEAFYKKYFRGPMVDVPDEDIDIFKDDPPASVPTHAVQNPAMAAKVTEAPVNDLLDDPDDLPALNEPSDDQTAPINENELVGEGVSASDIADIDAMLDDINNGK